MNFYLSSYKEISQPKRFNSLLPKANKRIAYIANALDYSRELARRKQREKFDLRQLTKLGLEPENIDLQEFFGKIKNLEKTLDKFGAVWVRGGNVFVLRQAMKLSGLDKLLKKKVNDDFLYAGYSAGSCVLAPSLKGLHLVDDPAQKPYPNQQKVIWSGLNLIDFAIAPHYDSRHPESEAIRRVVDFYMKHKIKHRKLKDGQVIIIRK